MTQITRTTTALMKKKVIIKVHVVCKDKNEEGSRRTQSSDLKKAKLKQLLCQEVTLQLPVGACASVAHLPIYHPEDVVMLASGSDRRCCFMTHGSGCEEGGTCCSFGVLYRCGGQSLSH